MITKKFIFEMKHRSTEASKHRRRQGKQKTQPLRCQVFSFAALACQPPANEGKFTRRLGNKISLTWAQNFLSEVGILGAFQGKAMSKIFLNGKSLLQKFPKTFGA